MAQVDRQPADETPAAPADPPRPVTIALAGNPNCGKTTLFNALTGSRQRVGNWPGVTVERIEGGYEHEGRQVHVVDLPGIYSFSAYAIDETIARDYILREQPAVVVNIIDATNLERNLYLTTQLIEMKVPVVVALNMMDLAARRKLKIEVEHLATHLGCPVVPLVAAKGKGVGELRRAIARAADTGEASATQVVYDSEAEEAVEAIRPAVAELAAAEGYDPRWLTIKLLEGDPRATELADEQLLRAIRAETDRVEKHTGEDMDIVIADGRYGFIHGLARDVLHRDLEIRRTVTDAVDRVMLNRLLGIPLFFGVMYLIFLLTIDVGEPFIDFFNQLCRTIFVDGFRALLESVSSPAMLTTLLADGLGGGIRTVATFIPPIFFIFLCLSALEDSGYMARAAFVMDRLLRGIGLPGKAFLPMMVAFGCNVPAILATRTLEKPRDRIMTVLINPFMSCGAKLPVYTLFAVAFFPQNAGTLVFSLYVTGIVLGVLTGLLLKHTVLTGQAATFVMELPPYHLPTVGGILHHTWNKLKSFILRAGKVILAAVIVLSLLNSIGSDGSFGNEQTENSIIAAVGKRITPVFGPMGIREDNWPATVGLFTGVFAKETVVGTLDNLYGQMDAEAGQAAGRTDGEAFDFWGGIRRAFGAIPAGFAADDEESDEPQVASSTFGAMHRRFGSGVAAVAYQLFILLYAPCIAAMAAVYRETNVRWTIFCVVYVTLLAWIVSTSFYQTATFLDHPAGSTMWLGIAAGLLAAIYVAMRWVSPKVVVA